MQGASYINTSEIFGFTHFPASIHSCRIILPAVSQMPIEMTMPLPWQINFVGMCISIILVFLMRILDMREHQ